MDPINKKRRISLSWKIFGMATSLVIISVLLLLTASNWLTSRLISDTTLKTLTSIGQTKKLHIENIFNTFQKQIVTYSNNQMIAEAMRNFIDTYSEIINDNHLKPDQLKAMREKVKAYYINDYTAAFKTKNRNSNPQDVGRIVDGLSDEAIAYQFYHIADNESPLGEKAQQDKHKEDFSEYIQFHTVYHPKIRQFAKEFGYGDVLLVDSETGTIMYSASKEIDLGTSLLEGPYQETHLGKLFRKVNEQENLDYVGIADFEPYAPVYEGATGFIASPIPDWGEKIGVLIFQLPIEEINGVATSHRQWKEIGLGETGETYLIGHDLFLRNNSRFLFADEDQISPEYIAQLRENGVPEPQIQAIEDKKNTILNQQITTTGSEALAKGKHGNAEYIGYLGKTVIGAYAPLAIEGLQWGIMAEIQKEEIDAQVSQVRNGILLSALLILAIAGVSSLLLAKSFTRRIHRNIKDLNQISETKDLTQQIEILSNDEISDMAKGLNQFITDFRDIVRHIDDNSTYLASSSTQLSSTVEDISQTTKSIAKSTDLESASIAETTQNIQQLAHSFQETNELIQTIQGIANESQEYSTKCSEAIDKTNQSMSKIEDSSQQIVGIINVITEIANQTNLLSLNAAIEAAKAGDVGKGFAVVADEIRSLAERSGNAVVEIKSIIDVGSQQVAQGKQIIETTGGVLAQIISKVNQFSDLLNKIVHVTVEQSARVQNIAKATEALDKDSEENADSIVKLSDALNEISQTSDDLRQMADQLDHQISQFKT